MLVESVRLCDACIDSVFFVVTALATKPANTIEKMVAWTASFIILLPPGKYFPSLLVVLYRPEYIPAFSSDRIQKG
jgi:hypothetical protein